MKKNVIFDFDGTLADTSPVIYTAVNNVISLLDMKPLTWDEYKNIRNKSHLELIKEYYRLLPRLPQFITKAQSEMNLLMQAVQPFTGIVQMLVTLKNNRKHIGILSSNTKENIEIFIQKYGLDMFDFVHTEKNLFGKAHALKNLLQKYGFKKDETIYVGDETRDIEACKKIGLDLISVSWGFNSKKSLKKHKPQMLLDDVNELLPGILNYSS